MIAKVPLPPSMGMSFLTYIEAYPNSPYAQMYYSRKDNECIGDLIAEIMVTMAADRISEVLDETLL